MRIRKGLCLSAIAVAGLALTGSVQAREFADIYTECGLGAMIAPTNEVVAAVTNVTWDLGTTAISSNASSPDSCKGGGAKTAALILKTYSALEKDLANGEGEHLSALLHTAEISQSEHEAVIAALRPAFSDLVVANGYADTSLEVKAANLHALLYSTI